jgi:hypothetical protein
MTWARTEVAKCVLEFVDELYEILVHVFYLGKLFDSGELLEGVKGK